MSTALNGVPALPLNFLPRPADLNPLRELVLRAENRKAAITGRSARVGLHGMGGIGKTVLATALAHDPETQAMFPDGIFWLTLGTQADLVARQKQLVYQLKGDPGAVFDTQSGKAELNRLLETRRCLILLDDAWKAGDLEAFDLQGTACRILVTTRDAGLVRGFGAEPHCLDVLSEDAALVLLRGWVAIPVKKNELAKEIIKECGCLPLALAAIGAVLAEEPDRWESILKALRQTDLAELEARFPGYAYPDVLKALTVSVEALPQTERERFLDFALFPADTAIPRHILEQLWEQSGLNADQIGRILQSLKNRSLIQADEQQVTLHDLYHDYATRLCPALQAGHARLLAAFKKWKGSQSWQNLPLDAYWDAHLAYHMKEAGQAQTLRSLLLDAGWIKRRVDLGQCSGLVADYNFQDQDEALRLIQGGLRLSAHVLQQDPSQLAAQMLGRMLDFPQPEIQALLESLAGQMRGKTWLRPMKQTFTPPGGALKRTLENHSGWVFCLISLQDGRRVVSGSNSGNLRIWDVESGKCLNLLKGHSSSITCLISLLDTRRVVSGSSDCTLRVWDVETGECLYMLEGHSGRITCLIPLADGHRVISGSEDSTLRIWDIENGKCLNILKGHSWTVNCLISLADGRRVISGSNDHTLRIWDAEMGECLHVLKGHIDSISCLISLSDSQRVVSGSKDHSLIIWDVETGISLKRLEGHSGSVTCLISLPDRTHIVSGSEDGTLRIWDIEAGKEIKILQGHSSSINCLIFLLDGRYLVSDSFDGKLLVWDVMSGECLYVMDKHLMPINCLIPLPDGQCLVSGSADGTIRVWDIGSKYINASEEHSGLVTCLISMADGQRIVSGSNDCTLRIWNTKSRECLMVIRELSSPIKNLISLPDSQRFISESGDGILHIWDVGTGKCLGVITGPKILSSYQLSLIDERRLVTGSSGNNLQIWDILSGECIHTLKGHLDKVNCLISVQNGRRVISGSKDHTLRIWDAESGECLHVLRGHSDNINCLIFLPDSKIVSGSNDSTLRIWDIETGKCLHTLRGHNSAIDSLISSPDGQYVISGSWDSNLRIWNVESGECMQTMIGHSDSILSLVLTTDGQRVVSGSWDYTLRIWDMKCAKCITFIQMDAIILRIICLENLIVVGESGGKIHFLRLEEPTEEGQ